MPSGRAIRAGLAYVELQLRKTKFEKGLKSLGDGLLRLGSQAIRFGAIMTGIGTALATSLAFPLAGFAAFEDQMLTVRAVTRATGEEFKRLNDLAKRLGGTTSFTAAQVAGAQVEQGRAGFNPDEILAATKPILDLARSTGTELAESAEIAAAALRQFELDASEAARVADVLAAGTNRSAQRLTDLFEALKPVGPLAKEAGEDLEGTVASIALLANVGIKGSLAGSSLARAYKNLSTELKQKELQKLSNGLVSAVDKNGDLKSLGDILNQLGVAVAGFPSAKRLAVFETLFGRGQVAALKLANAGPELAKFADDLRNVEGEAARLAAEMDSGLGGAIRILQSSIEGVSLAIGEALKPEAVAVAQILSSWAGTITKTIEANRKLVVAIALTAGALLAIGAGTTAAGLSLSVLGVAFQGLSKASSLSRKTLLTSMNLTVAGVKKFRGAFVSILKGLASPFKTIAAAILGSGRLIRTAILILLNPFVAIPVAIGLAVAAFLRFTKTGRKAVSDLVGAVLPLLERLRGSFGEITAALASGDIGAAARITQLAIIAEFRRVILWINQNFGGVVVFFQQTFNSIKDLVVTSWRATAGFVVSTWNATTKFLGKAFATVVNALSGPLDVLRSNFGVAVEDMFRDWAGFVAFFSKSWNEAQRFVANKIFDFAVFAVDANLRIEDAIASVAQKATQVWINAVGAIQSRFASFANFIGGIFNKIGDVIRSQIAFLDTIRKGKLPTPESTAEILAGDKAKAEERDRKRAEDLKAEQAAIKASTAASLAAQSKVAEAGRKAREAVREEFKRQAEAAKGNVDEDFDSKFAKIEADLAAKRKKAEDLRKANIVNAEADFNAAQAELNKQISDSKAAQAELKEQKLAALKSNDPAGIGDGIAEKIKEGSKQAAEAFGTFNARSALNRLANLRRPESQGERQTALLEQINENLLLNIDANLRTSQALENVGVA